MKRLICLLALAAACNNPKQAIDVEPKTATVPVNATQKFTAAVSGSPVSVTWTASCGTVDATGLYTAPATVGTCTVTATSTIATSFSGQAVVTVVLPANVVTVAPATASIDACTSVSLAATSAQGGTITWVVVEGAAGGTLVVNGLNATYTAPSTAGTYHVTAAASVGGSATATITVNNHVLSVAVSPTTATVTTGGQQQFTATVTTSCGTFPAQ